jgi:UDP-N-acetyl-D-glucosamine dehydrogenase
VRVAIIGQGYVGSALGVAATKAGHEVIGIEINPARVIALSSSVTFKVSSDYSLAGDCEVVVIAVPTPLNEKREPDLSYLQAACNSLQSVLRGSVLVINESTSFPGTLRNVIAPILGDKHLYAAAPERVDPANEKWGIENTPRLVAGLNSEATNKASSFYKSFCSSVIEVSSPEVAEAAKLFENTFRQVNIALVNEFAQIANSLGISTSETLEAASSKPYGFMPFVPSIGVGGHCIPVDPSYLSFAASNAGVEARFINLANEVNAGMPEFVVRRIRDLVNGDLKGKTIQIAGISYKAGVADTRESPALVLISLLKSFGAEVSWHDEEVGSLGDEASKPLFGADIGVIATAHPRVDYGPWKNGKTMVIDVSTAPHTGWPKFL